MSNRRQKQPVGPVAGRRTPTLAELQAQFQAAILKGDEAILGLIPNNAATTREVLLGVYRHAYWARLVEVIGNDHGLLRDYLGHDAFAAMARAYIAAHPSHHANVRWFSKRLPAFLAHAEPYASHPELGELAEIEWALNSAFDAAEATTLTLADLQSVPAESWGDLRFEPHPAARRLSLASNAFDIWQALKAGQSPPAARQTGDTTYILVWRQDTRPLVRVMATEEAMIWAEAAAGARFADLCELVAVFDNAEEAALRAARYLQGWLASGVLTTFSLRPKARRRRKVTA